MVRYALGLTRDPGGDRTGDVEALRAAGFDDAAVLDICQVASYYNYVNRLADGLGIELEPAWEGRELTMTRQEFEERRAARPVARPGEGV